MKIMKTIRNYYFYCGIEKDEYNAVKKDAYVSNFTVWRVLHFLMAAVFGGLFVGSLFSNVMSVNRWFYLFAFLYSIVAVAFFFVWKKDSLAAQLLIYLSMSILFLFACFIASTNPNGQATSFIVFLVITPMLMIDKPYFMTIELVVASSVFLLWMYGIKTYEIWQYDFINVVTYTLVGIFLNVIANSIRIREFVLTRKIKIQKDTDEMTGLRNKGSLTREINNYFLDKTNDKGILFVLDIDRFKMINDTYGHDVGDAVIIQVGRYLGNKFTDNDIVGRFGGDEFIVFIKGVDDLVSASELAGEVVSDLHENVELPDKDSKISASIGIAVYKGEENNYSELFKKADIALYKAKADPDKKINIYEKSS